MFLLKSQNSEKSSKVLSPDAYKNVKIVVCTLYSGCKRGVTASARFLPIDFCPLYVGGVWVCVLGWVSVCADLNAKSGKGGEGGGGRTSDQSLSS